MGGITSNDHSDMDSNAEFGGTEARARLESSLLKKVDARMSILILIYILNCAHSVLCIAPLHVLRTFAQILIEIVLRKTPKISMGAFLSYFTVQLGCAVSKRTLISRTFSSRPCYQYCTLAIS